MNEANALAKLFGALFFVFVPMLYLLPTYEAWNNKHKNLSSIVILNLFLGWSFIGWVAALIWAFKKQDESIPEKAGVKDQNIRKCPFCAEEIKPEAIKCKHCGSEVAATEGR